MIERTNEELIATILKSLDETGRMFSRAKKTKARKKSPPKKAARVRKAKRTKR